jgi:hypothetical protein
MQQARVASELEVVVEADKRTLPAQRVAIGEARQQALYDRVDQKGRIEPDRKPGDQGEANRSAPDGKLAGHGSPVGGR